MQAVVSYFETSSSDKQRSAPVVFVVGKSVSITANPIIGPPAIIFFGSLTKPSAASINSLQLVPMQIRKFLGSITESPVSVKILSITGLPSTTAV